MIVGDRFVFCWFECFEVSIFVFIVVLVDGECLFLREGGIRVRV